MRYKYAIGSAAIVVAIIACLPNLLMMLHRAKAARQVEAEYQRMLKSQESVIYTDDPNLLDRVAADKVLAGRIQSVVLLEPRPDRDFASLSRLPNAKDLKVSYADAEQLDAILPAINQMPSLKHAGIYYCSGYDWLSELKNPTLESLAIHAFQREEVSDKVIERCQHNMPNCTISVTGDED